MTTRKSLKRQLADLLTEQDAIRQRIYAACSNSNVPFDQCWRKIGETMGGAYTQDHYLAVDSAITAIETRAVAEGKAYRGSLGNLIWFTGKLAA
jgi:hypothetical protein